MSRRFSPKNATRPTPKVEVEGTTEARSRRAVRRKMRRAELYIEQDKADDRRDELIGDIEKQLTSRHVSMPVFQVRWVMR